jgi:hypothetical protein
MSPSTRESLKRGREDNNDGQARDCSTTRRRIWTPSTDAGAVSAGVAESASVAESEALGLTTFEKGVNPMVEYVLLPGFTREAH